MCAVGGEIQLIFNFLIVLLIFVVSIWILNVILIYCLTVKVFLTLKFEHSFFNDWSRDWLSCTAARILAIISVGTGWVHYKSGIIDHVLQSWQSFISSWHLQQTGIVYAGAQIAHVFFDWSLTIEFIWQWIVYVWQTVVRHHLVQGIIQVPRWLCYYVLVVLIWRCYWQ